MLFEARCLIKDLQAAVVFVFFDVEYYLFSVSDSRDPQISAVIEIVF